MAKSHLSCLAFAACAAALLAACDTGGADGAQGEAVQVADFTGSLDRTFTGEPMPKVTVTNLDGETLDLAALQEPVLVNLWAEWCVPCAAEMPLLDALAADVAGEVLVLTVSVDLRGEEPTAQFFAENDLPNLPSWMDQPNDLALAYGGGPVLPMSVLYDANGNEVWRMIGAYDWSSEQAKAEVLEALEPVTPAPRVEATGDVGPIEAENRPEF